MKTEHVFYRDHYILFFPRLFVATTGFAQEWEQHRKAERCLVQLRCSRAKALNITMLQVNRHSGSYRHYISVFGKQWDLICWLRISVMKTSSVER